MLSRKLVHPIRFVSILFLFVFIICAGMTLEAKSVDENAAKSLDLSVLSGEIIIPEDKTEEEALEDFYLRCVRHDLDPGEAQNLYISKSGI